MKKYTLVICILLLPLWGCSDDATVVSNDSRKDYTVELDFYSGFTGDFVLVYCDSKCVYIGIAKSDMYYGFLPNTVLFRSSYGEHNLAMSIPSLGIVEETTFYVDFSPRVFARFNRDERKVNFEVAYVIPLDDSMK